MLWTSIDPMIHVHCSYTSHGQHHEATHRLPTKQQVIALIVDRLTWDELTRMEIVPQGRVEPELQEPRLSG